MVAVGLGYVILVGYAITVAVEVPVLVVGLSSRHSVRRRVLAGFWLTACTYPIVTLVIPAAIDPQDARFLCLVAAETFAPLGECALFWGAFGTGGGLRNTSAWRDFGVITLANLASFALGEWLHATGCL